MELFQSATAPMSILWHLLTVVINSNAKRSVTGFKLRFCMEWHLNQAFFFLPVPIKHNYPFR